VVEVDKQSICRRLLALMFGFKESI
jgi:hypothetical protein